LVWLLLGSGLLLGGGATVLLLVRRNREDGPAGPPTPWPARIEAEELGVGYGWDG
jgi:hypothetical protein